ncbi:hypothetical protein [Chitinophaga sp.]|uniref:hypothetical protein n=1 Tax=Chitinophaga sp. TaxID=1869181 RepID=UPI0031DA49DA
MTYEERLQHYAQMHANDFNAAGYRLYAGAMPETRNPTDGDMMSQAEVTIAAVAEGIRNFNKMHIPDYMEEGEPIPDSCIEEYLIENGYVPKP